MEVRNLLSADAQNPQARPPQPSIEADHTSPYKWQSNGMSSMHAQDQLELAQSPQRPHIVGGSAESPYSASSGPPKSVAFELIIPEAPQQRARLPMRVNIYPHDATDSIVTTVKNFYGLYDGNGVSFEDKEGNTLIARYENFQNRMTVYVRVTEEAYSSAAATPRLSQSPKRPLLGPPFEPNGATQEDMYGQPRPASRTARPRSVSPHGRGRRSVSVSTNPKSRSRPTVKSRTGSTQGSFADGQFDRDMSDSDGGDASVTSSRRGKVAEVVSADISVENIVEGGRRKRARFDSSELPLFVPSQVPMPTSISSVSPQRRIGQPNFGSPFQYSNQHTFSYQQPLPSPQSRTYSDMQTHNNAGTFTPSYGNRELRQRPAQYPAARYSNGSGILPTPDPTIGSVISDEDVALQLMRLGEASNFSSHGRTSTSTVDDALSGKAEASDYSDDASDADDEDLPPAGYVSDEYSVEEYDDRQDATFNGNSDSIVPGHMHQQHPAHKLVKTKSHGDKSDGTAAPRKVSKSASLGPKPVKSKKSLDNGSAKTPISPTSLPTQSRKASNASLTYGPDEEDLSAKPRCQRCRKSKKGCDRQRPCGRCRDAGIGIEGCVSEDEGNGRKGRYGRHMGVPIKRDDTADVAMPGIPPVMTQQTGYQPQSGMTQAHAHAHSHSHSPSLGHGHGHSHSHSHGGHSHGHGHGHSHSLSGSMGHMPMGPPSLMGVSQKKRKR